jgi:hypothetical protein
MGVKKASPKGAAARGGDGEDPNAIVETPNPQPFLRVWAWGKAGSKAGKNKKGEDDEVACAYAECKNRKVKEGAVLLSHSVRDANPKTAPKRFEGVEEHCHLGCEVGALLSKGVELDKLPGWADMAEEHQDAAQKMFWKANAKLKSREKRLSGLSKASAESNELETKLAEVDLK